jgi:S-adenosylmethionine-diacylglycerol 3-amino-3-carboxypropyl transferase
MDRPSFRSDIFYSVQNEDYRTELAVLGRVGGTRQRVLIVASSGENVLSLLAQDTIASIDAVDLNPTQLHLCELRRTAARQLTRDEQLRLLGCDPAISRAADQAGRLTLFERIRPFLPVPSRAFWDERRDNEIAFGIHHVGRNDIAMRDIQAHLLAAGFAPLRRPLADADLPKWRSVYTDLMTAPYVRDLFGLPSEALAAKIAAISGYLGECHFRALQQPYAERNPFVTTVFADAYATAAGEDGLPLYLQLRGQAALRQLGTEDRLRLHTSNMVERMVPLADAYGPFDLISISNIADWMTDVQFGALVIQARSCLAPGGALLARTATSSTMIREVMATGMTTDPDFDAELLEVERGPWFRMIAVGFRALV